MIRQVITSAAFAVDLGLSAINLVVQYMTYLDLKESHPDVSLRGVPGSDSLMVTLATGLVHPWTFLTATWTEHSVSSLVLTLFVLVLGCQYFERIWGTRSLVKYLALVSIGPVIVNFVVFFVGYLLSQTAQGAYTELLNRRINGGTAFHVAFAVAFKQAIPLHTINIFKGTIKVPIKYIAMPVLLLYTVCGILIDSTYLILSWSSLILSWWYLRFIKSIVADNLSLDGATTVLKGDKSDSFAFAKFFYPLPVTNLVALVSNRLYSLFVAAKIVQPFDDDQVAASNQRARNDNDVERRRALALRELGSL